MRIGALLCVVLFAAGCGARPEIVLDYDKGHDFSSYKTFVWMDDEPLTVEGNQRVPDRALAAAEQAVRAQMLEKGYVEVEDRDEADFGVGVVLGVNQTVVFDATDRTVYAATERSGYAVNRRGPRRDSVVVSRSGYEEVSLDPLAHMADLGKIAVQIYDLESGDAVWSVSGTRDVTNVTADGSQAERAFQRLLRDFPPE